MMKLLQAYKNIIRKNCLPQGDLESFGIAYWSDKLFAETIIYLLPLCLIALAPGVYFSFLIQNYSLAIFDLTIFFLILIIGFVGTINIQIKKVIFLICMYSLGIFLLYEIGIGGPGLIYLFAANIFSLLIFPIRFPYLWSSIILIIILVFGFLINFELAPHLTINPNSVSEWIAVTSNLIFISFISSALIPKLFVGLEKTILKKDQVQAELKIALQKTKEKNEDLEHFTYVVSHDLQEPIRMISSFLALLEKKYDEILDQKGKQYIFYAVDGAKRMREIILQLLDFSRMSRLESSTEMCDIQLMVDEIIQDNQKLIENSDSTITTTDLPRIIAQKTALQHLFHNIISNALKYKRDDVPLLVQISYKDLNNFHQFEIKDNGIGIETIYFEKIFVIFQRLHDRTKYQGTGMGLAICKKILEKIGGEIWVKSTPEIGSTFFFTIPKVKIVAQ
ncbi:sensor histidine kinase [Belliella aquatica]|nr:ATP-binding protein [Belliella aquatica]MCH7407342.1 ATP-binding protein [Belliella aquatica]